MGWEERNRKREKARRRWERWVTDTRTEKVPILEKEKTEQCEEKETWEIEVCEERLAKRKAMWNKKERYEIGEMWKKERWEIGETRKRDREKFSDIRKILSRKENLKILNIYIKGSEWCLKKNEREKWNKINEFLLIQVTWP